MPGLDGLQAFSQFIFAIASLIIVHEIGHFLASKLVGIEVEEFGIGFPPRILTLFEAGGTKFSLNWIPLGGFVRPKGENDPDDPSGLAAAKPWKRIVVLIAGPLMNFIAAIFLYTLVVYQFGDPVTDQILVIEVSPGSPAASVGLQPGDLIESLDNNPIDSMEEISAVVQENLGKEIQIEFVRDGESIFGSLTPRVESPQGQGPIGIGMTNPRQPVSVGRAFSEGVLTVGSQIYSLATLPGRLVGYKGMYDLYSYMRDLDSDTPTGLPSGLNTLSFFAAISTSLAVLNLLPFPAFDGGRILFTLPEMFFRKRIPVIYENLLNLVGLGLIVAVMIYVNLQDFLDPVELP